MLWRKGSTSSGNPPQGSEAAAGGQGTAPTTSHSVIADTVSHIVPRNDATAESARASSTASQQELQRRTTIAIRQSVAFAQIVSVLARSPAHKFFTLADLEWLVIPPLMTGQYAVAEAKAQAEGPAVPVAIVLWAKVSSEVDTRLCENLAVPIRLRPDEWRSGEIPWLVDAVGDARVLPGFLKQLAETAWKGRAPKMRALGADGKIVVKPLAEGGQGAASG